MNQANVNHLVSKLRFNVGDKARTLRNVEGPVGRARKIQKSITALLKYERLEMYYNRADEVRGYAERLISEAIRRGPAEPEMMELADYWILEKQYIHKLFKVLVPRFQNYTTSYTNIHRIQKDYPGHPWRKSVLELKGNPYPSLEQSNPFQSQLIHNQLLNEARKQFRLEKYKKLAEEITK